MKSYALGPGDMCTVCGALEVVAQSSSSPCLPRRAAAAVAGTGIDYRYITNAQVALWWSKQNLPYLPRGSNCTSDLTTVPGSRAQDRRRGFLRGRRLGISCGGRLRGAPAGLHHHAGAAAAAGPDTIVVPAPARPPDRERSMARQPLKVQRLLAAVAPPAPAQRPRHLRAPGRSCSIGSARRTGHLYSWSR